MQKQTVTKPKMPKDGVEVEVHAPTLTVRCILDMDHYDGGSMVMGFPGATVSDHETKQELGNVFCDAGGANLYVKINGRTYCLMSTRQAWEMAMAADEAYLLLRARATKGE